MTSMQTAVVLAGAAARGAYEAGALSRMVPALQALSPPPIFVGTSAGAINAAALTGLMHKEADVAGSELCALWSTTTLRQVMKPILPALLSADLKAHLAACNIPTTSNRLLDNSPLRATLCAKIRWDKLHDNIREGCVRALAVVATSTRFRRATAFVEGDHAAAPRAAGFDLRSTTLGIDHVLASSAVPVAFPAVAIPPHSADWYIDGGVRMNAPIEPALALGGARLLVLSTTPRRRCSGPSSDPASKPDVPTLGVQIFSAVLTEGISDYVHVTDGGPSQHVLLAPDPSQHTDPLSEAARRAYQCRPWWRRLSPLTDMAILRRLFGRQPAAWELLSYAYFEPEFLHRAVELGQRDAAHWPEVGNVLLEAVPGKQSTPTNRCSGQ